MPDATVESPKVQCARVVAREHPGVLAHVEQVARLAAALFDALQPLHGLAAGDRALLVCSALLHDIGVSEGLARHHKTSRRMIRAASLPGLTAEEREVVANVARYHRKAEPSVKQRAFRSMGPKAQETVRRLAAILRVADGLDRAHEDAVREIRAANGPGPDEWTLRVGGDGDLDYAIAGAARKAGLLESVYGVRLAFKPMEPSDKGDAR